MAKVEKIVIKKVEAIALNFFAVRAQDGKWFRSKGYGGYGRSWVDDINTAKIYGNISSAKRQVTYWASNYPEYGIPELVQITSGTCEYIDQTERVMKAIKVKMIATAQKKVNNLDYKIKQYLDTNNYNRVQIAQWQEQLLEAKHTLSKIK